MSEKFHSFGFLGCFVLVKKKKGRKKGGRERRKGKEERRKREREKDQVMLRH